MAGRTRLAALLLATLLVGQQADASLPGSEVSPIGGVTTNTVTPAAPVDNNSGVAVDSSIQNLAANAESPVGPIFIGPSAEAIADATKAQEEEFQAQVDTQVKAAEDEAFQYQESANALRDEASAIENEITQTNLEERSALGELDMVKKSVESITKLLNQKRTDISKLAAQQSQWQREVDDMKAQIAKKKNDLKLAEQKFKDSQSAFFKSKTSESDQFEKLQKQRAFRKDELLVGQRKVETETQEAIDRVDKTAQSRIIELNKEIAEQGRNVEQNLNNLKKEEENLVAVLDADYKKRMGLLDTEYQRRMDDYKQLRGRLVADMNQNIGWANESLNTALSAMKEAQDRVNSAENEVKQRKNRIAQLEITKQREAHAEKERAYEQTVKNSEAEFARSKARAEQNHQSAQDAKQREFDLKTKLNEIDPQKFQAPQPLPPAPPLRLPSPPVLPPRPAPFKEPRPAAAEQMQKVKDSAKAAAQVAASVMTKAATRAKSAASGPAASAALAAAQQVAQNTHAAASQAAQTAQDVAAAGVQDAPVLNPVEKAQELAGNQALGLVAQMSPQVASAVQSALASGDVTAAEASVERAIAEASTVSGVSLDALKLTPAQKNSPNPTVVNPKTGQPFPQAQALSIVQAARKLDNLYTVRTMVQMKKRVAARSSSGGVNTPMGGLKSASGGLKSAVSKAASNLPSVPVNRFRQTDYSIADMAQDAGLDVGASQDVNDMEQPVFDEVQPVAFVELEVHNDNDREIESENNQIQLISRQREISLARLNELKPQMKTLKDRVLAAEKLTTSRIQQVDAKMVEYSRSFNNMRQAESKRFQQSVNEIRADFQRRREIAREAANPEIKKRLDSIDMARADASAQAQKITKAIPAKLEALANRLPTLDLQDRRPLEDSQQAVKRDQRVWDEAKAKRQQVETELSDLERSLKMLLNQDPKVLVDLAKKEENDLKTQLFEKQKEQNLISKKHEALRDKISTRQAEMYTLQQKQAKAQALATEKEEIAKSIRNQPLPDFSKIVVAQLTQEAAALQNPAAIESSVLGPQALTQSTSMVQSLYAPSPV